MKWWWPRYWFSQRSTMGGICCSESRSALFFNIWFSEKTFKLGFPPLSATCKKMKTSPNKVFRKEEIYRWKYSSNLRKCASQSADRSFPLISVNELWWQSVNRGCQRMPGGVLDTWWQMSYRSKLSGSEVVTLSVRVNI